MFSVAFLTLAASVAANDYGAPADNKDVKNVDKNVKAHNVAEAYISTKNKDGSDAAIYYSTAHHGDSHWAPPKRLYWENLYDPRGVKLCGPKNEAGQHKWLYVADAGNADVGGYVNRYLIKRDDDNVGKLEVEKAEVVYGDGSGNYRPTDLSCDEEGNVWWNDEAANEIRWAKDADLAQECSHNACKGAQFVYGCEHAIENLQAIEVAGNWVYWSQKDDQVDKWAPADEKAEHDKLDDDAVDAKKELAEANNGVWRAAKDAKVQCQSCYGAEEKGKWPSQCGKGDEIEFFSRKDDGYTGLAAHNDNIYAVANDKDVYSLGKNEPEAERVEHGKYSAGGEKVSSYVADAKGRGLLVVDEIDGHGYVVPDDHKAPVKAWSLPKDVYAYGVAYGASQEVEDVDFETSAVSMAVSAFAGLVAIAALF